MPDQSDNEYTATMDELIDGYRAMRVRELFEPSERMAASIEAVAEARRAIAAHDAVKDRQIAELKAKVLAVRLIAYEEFDSEKFATIYVRLHAALTATGQEQSNG